MNPDRWNRIKEILDVALRQADGEREKYLARACEGDADLREEVESLIKAYDGADAIFESEPARSRDPYLGAMVGPYRILDLIGSGGMGSVYRACRADDAFEKEVAIKVVRRGLDLDYMVRHFRRERQIMATLEHPNIARLLDGGATADGLPYFVMEFIRGRPVDRYCDEQGLGMRQRLDLFTVVCGAVEFAHRAAVVHRDIKPGNILVTSDGVPKLLDFGIAKILNPERVPGTKGAVITAPQAMTPEYASPEQTRGEPVTEASDVYSLGVLLCEMLVAKRPRGSELPPGLPRDIEMIIRMATREEPARRYPSAGVFRDDVRRYLDGLPVRARKGALGYRARKFVRRQKTIVVAVAAGLALPGAIYIGLEARNRWLDSSAPPQIITVTSAAGREFQPAFSPDGKRVVYSASGETGENTDVYLQDIGGSQPFRLTTDPADDLSPVWSPDGRRIAWLRTGPKETAIFVSKAEGGVHAKVADVFPTRLESVGRHLDWAPDGKSLAASDKDGPGLPFRIVLIDVVNGRKKEATLPPENIIGDMAPAFSPDGKWLAFIRAVSSGVCDVWIVRTAGGEPRRVTFDNRSVLSMTWGPDGRSIVFSSNRMRNHALWRTSISGGPPTRVPLVSENAADPAFSRDGRRMVYAQFFDDTNIWRFDLAAHNTRKIVSSSQYDSSPSISPDGSRIAFRSNRSGSNEIWESDAEGRAAWQLTHVGGALTGSPRWSPDGKWIAFDSRPDGQADIYVIPAGGGGMRRVSNSPAEDVVPRWSHDGAWIYFASIRSGAWQVWRAHPEGDCPEEQVTRMGGFAAAESQDGKYLYYAKGRADNGLWRKRLPDGIEEQFVEELKAGFWGYWVAAAKGVFFLDWPGPGKSASLWYQPSTGKGRLQIGNVSGPPAVGDSGFALSPDGRYLLYSQVDQSGSDILVLEHYRN